MDLCRQGYAVIFGVLTFFYGAIFLALIELLGICIEKRERKEKKSSKSLQIK
jgi:hypothetical protein